MRTMHRAGAGLIALALAVGVAACGDDDDDAATTTTAATDGESASGDNAAFCDGLVEFNSAALASDAGADGASEEDLKAAGEELAPLSQTLVDEAPNDELAEAAEEVHGFIEPLLEGDAEAFTADATFDTYLAFVGQASEECGFPEVEVTGKDYAFDAPATLEAGTVSFAFTNASESEEHEMIVFSRAPGVDLSFQELLELPEEESEEKVIFTTAAFAAPGESSSTMASLAPGEYAMVCFIPVGGAEDGPPHFTQGMLHEFTVE